LDDFQSDEGIPDMNSEVDEEALEEHVYEDNGEQSIYENKQEEL
jgi:hypothetical protein